MFGNRSGAPGVSNIACVTCRKELTVYECNAYMQLGGRCMQCFQSPLQPQEPCISCGQAIAPLDSQVVRCSTCGRRTHCHCDSQALQTLRAWTPGQDQPLFVCMACRIGGLPRGAAPLQSLALQGQEQHSAHPLQGRTDHAVGTMFDQEPQDHGAAVYQGGAHGVLQGVLQGGLLGGYGQLEESLGGYSEPSSLYGRGNSKLDGARKLKELANIKLKLDGIQPRRGRSAFNIFQHEMSRGRTQHRANDPHFQYALADKWAAMSPGNRAQYEQQAQDETEQYQRDKEEQWTLQQQYDDLRAQCIQDGLLADEDEPSPSHDHHAPARGARASKRDREAMSEDFSDPPQKRRGRVVSRSPSRAPSGTVSEGLDDEGDHDGDSGPRDPYAVEYDDIGDVTVLPIVCNGRRGVFLPQQMRALCLCNSCIGRHPRGKDMSCTQFEQHCGMGGAKKWKASLKVEPGCVPEVPAGNAPMQLGKWLEMKGFEGARRRPPDASAAHGHQERSSHGTRLSSGAISLHDAKMKVSPTAPAPSAKTYSKAMALKSIGKTMRADSPVVSGAAPPVSGKGGLAPSGPGDMAPGVPAVPEGPRRVPATAMLPDNPWMAVPTGRYKAVKVLWAGDRCCVCDGDVDYDHDQLISCDRCGILVHQMCYGIPNRPDPDDLWLCRSCEYMEEQEGGFGGTVGAPVPAPQCCLCPVTGGALKPCTVPGLWAHSACSQWLGGELCVLNFATMEPIDGIHLIQKERWELRCHICKQSMGAKLQCQQCYLAFHPLCARLAGLDMRVQEVEGEHAPRMMTFCHRHGHFKPHMSGVQMALDRASAAFLARRQLVNGQLWEPTPAVDLPQCSMGCARAQPLQPWSRTSHGTGTGHSTTEGFWLPPRPPTPPQPEVKPSAPTPPPGAITALKPVPKNRNNAKSQSKPQPGDGPPPPKVDLLPMPVGVPDKVEVMCNGRGPVTFLVRQQRVLYEDQEISPSRFEQLCGKGDAKKWKSSLHALDAHGCPVMCMGDWLAKHGLDKATMAKLVNNWNAYEAYEAWRIAKEDEEGAEGDKPPDFLTARAAEADEQDKQAAAAQANQGAAAVIGNSLPDAMDGSLALDLDAAAGHLQAQDGEHLALAGATPLDLTEGAMMDLDNLSGLPEGASGRSSAQLPMMTGEMDGGHGTTFLDLPMMGDRTANLSAEEVLQAEAGAGGPLGLNGGPSEDVGHSLLEDSLLQLPDNGNELLLRSMTPASAADSLPGPSGPLVEGPLAPAEGAPPSEYVGWNMRVFWPADGEWYQGRVKQYDNDMGRHLVHYDIDGEAEWLDIGAEVRSGRVQWLPRGPPDSWPAVPKAPHPAFQQLVDAKFLVPATTPPAKGPVSMPKRLSGPLQGPPAAGTPEDPGTHRGSNAQLVSNHAPASDERSERAGAATDSPHVNGVTHNMAQDPPAPQGSGPAAPASAREQEYAGPTALQESVGWRVGIWWQDDQTYYPGTVLDTIDGIPAGSLEGTPAGPHILVLYDDGIKEWINIETEKLRWMRPPPGTALPEPTTTDTQDPALAAAAEAAAAAAALADVAAAPVEQAAAFNSETPEQVEIICGSQRGVYDVAGGYCLLAGSGRRVTPTEFERLGGKGSSKKWKSSIRVHLGDGISGSSMAEWLVESGIEQPAAPRQRTSGSGSHGGAHQWSTRNAGGSHGRQSGAGGGDRHALPRPRAPHPPMCTCIICKQARKRMGLAADAPLPAPKYPPASALLPPRPPPPAYPPGTQPSDTPLPDFHTHGALPQGKAATPELPTLPGPPAGVAGPAEGPESKPGPGVPPPAHYGYVVYPRPSDPAVEVHRLPSYHYVPRTSENRRKGDSTFIPVVPDPLMRGSGGMPRWGKQAFLSMQPQYAKGPTRHCRTAGEVPCRAWDPLDWARKQGLPSTLALDSIEGPGVTSDTRRHAESHMRGFARRHAPCLPVEDTPEGAPAPFAAQPPLGPLAEPSAGPPTEHVATKPHGNAHSAEAEPASAPENAAAAPDGPDAADLPGPAADSKADDADTGPVLDSEAAAQPAVDAAEPAPVEPRQLRSAAQGDKGREAGSDDDSDGTDDETDEMLEGKVEDLLERQEERIKNKVPLTIAQRVGECVATEKARVMFGKSGIHGWGLMARQDMAQDSMVLEYRAQVVRRSLADKREEEYKQKGIECYFFTASEDIVMDSTYQGSMARFTNHCCMPNMYTRVIEMDGELRLIWMARTDIQAGQELTFSYRFKEEEGEHKVPCLCGAPNCRGFLN